MIVIPAIDIIDGQCVRLTQGDYSAKTVYSGDPVAVAKQFEDAGLRRLHVVDLDGAKAGEIKNLKVLEGIATATSLDIDFGGGVKTSHAVSSILNAGARWVTVGSIAAKSPDTLKEWLKDFGSEKFLLGADVRGKMIAVHGWTETTSLDIFEFLETWTKAGIVQAFCTDISKDGLLQGPSLELYRQILGRIPELRLIASGGVSNTADLTALQESGCYGAIVGKAWYEGRISLEQLVNLSA